MSFGDRMYGIIRRKTDNESTQQPKLPINMGNTSATIPSPIHKSDALGDDNPNGRDGNDWQTPTPEGWLLETPSGDRLQDIANSHLSEGPNPGKIPRAFNLRNNGKLGQNLTGTRGGNIGLILNISGNKAGGLGDAQYIPHTSILRPAGKSVGSARTIADGAMIPGVYLADPTRR